MTMWAGLAVNEICSTYLDVSSTPQQLPGMVAVNNGRLGFQTLIPAGPNQGKPFTPGHAWINVERGDVRVTTSGQAPDDNFGTLYPAGSVIDWSDGDADYQAFIKNALFVAVNGPTARLTISYRN